ncbi:MAG: hypothetical protein K2X91_03205 [Thermoleophilia bacterium]|nr:hypothetical protein [Thermoleophilia bacterium]
MRPSRIAWIGLVLAAALVGTETCGQTPPARPGESDRPEASAPPPAPLDAAERARIEAEAAGQSAEADRRFKARDFDGALPLYRAERASRARLGDRRYEAYAARAEGCCLAELGDDEAAIAAWQGAARIDAVRDDPGFEGYDWLLIANAQFRLERPDEVIASLRRAIPKLGDARDRDHECDAQVLLARVLVSLDRPEEADTSAARALDLAETLGDRRRSAAASLAAGLADAARGLSGLAAERLLDAHELFDKDGAASDSAFVLLRLGEVFADLDQLPAAIAALDDAAGRFATLDNRVAQAEALGLLAAALADDDRPDRAVAVAARVVALSRDLAEPERVVESLVRLGHYRSQDGDFPGAADALAEAVEAGRDDLPAARQVRVLLLCAEVERRAGRSDRVRKRLEEAEAIARRADNAALRRLVEDARGR